MESRRKIQTPFLESLNKKEDFFLFSYFFSNRIQSRRTFILIDYSPEDLISESQTSNFNHEFEIETISRGDKKYPGKVPCLKAESFEGSIDTPYIRRGAKRSPCNYKTAVRYSFLYRTRLVSSFPLLFDKRK